MSPVIVTSLFQTGFGPIIFERRTGTGRLIFAGTTHRWNRDRFDPVPDEHLPPLPGIGNDPDTVSSEALHPSL